MLATGGAGHESGHQAPAVVALRLQDVLVRRHQASPRIQIVNGLKKGTITRALNGKKVGTLIYRD